MAFPTVTDACLQESSCPGYVFPTIRDVARDGGVIALLFTHPHWDGREYQQYYGVAYSTDRGDSWSRVELSGSSSISGTVGYFPTGIVVRGMHAYLLIPFEEELGTGGWMRLLVDDIDLATGITTPRAMLPTGRVHDDGDALWGYQYFGPNPQFASTWYSWDIATGTMTDGVTETIPTDPPFAACASSDQHWHGAPSPLGGVSLHGNCHIPGQSYLFGEAVLPSRWQAAFTEIPEADWPVPPEVRNTESTFASYLHSSVLFTTDLAGTPSTHSARLVSGTTARVVVDDVGPGTIHRPLADAATWWGTDRQPFDDMIALVEALPDESSRVTLYRPGPSGAFTRVALPTRACDDGHYCGYLPLDFSQGLLATRAGGSLQWAMRLAPDEYLLFYVLDVMRPSSGQHQNVIFASRETVALGPAVAAGPLELACARASTCATAGAATMADCVTRWTDATIPPARLDAFLHATSCSELAAVDASVRDGATCFTEGQSCDGTAVVWCTGGIATHDDCAARGMTCVTRSGGAFCESPGCPTQGCDATGRAVRCDGNGTLDCPALGLTCTAISTGPVTCVTGGAACASASPGANVCVGDVMSFCTDGHEVPAFDCSRVPQVACDTTDHCVGAGDCDTVTFAPRCDGSRLRYCVYDSLREVDCAAVGGTCGADGSSRTRCLGGASPFDAGMPPADAGPPACGTARLGGPTVPETGVTDYPTPTGGTILDGTYYLTQFDLWSQAPQPYTHQETLVVAGSTLSVATQHSAIGVTSSSGSFTTTDTTLSYTTDCPTTMPLTWRYSVTPTGLVILDSARISTYVRQ